MRALLKNTIFIAAIFALAGITACKEKSYSTGSSSTTPGVTVPPVASEDAPLALKLTTIYNGTNYEHPLTFDIYDFSGAPVFIKQSATCEATDAYPEVGCVVTVPEARLYRSDILFQFARLPLKCKNLLFTPYSYMASTSATYIPPSSSTEVDCSGATAPPGAACFGGAAKGLVDGFPQFSRLYYTADEAKMTEPINLELSLDSGWKEGTRSNRRAANDMPIGDELNPYTAAELGGAGDGYVANTYEDYTFECEEDWADEQDYIIHLYITDENEDSAVTPTPNDLWTWIDHL